MTAITSGAQQIEWWLNGHDLGTVKAQGWFPGIPLRFVLPDDDLKAGGVNRVVLRYEHPLDLEGRRLALGIVNLVLTCRRAGATAQSADDLSTFAVLQLVERRGPSGGLAALRFEHLYGADPDEAFDKGVEWVRPDGRTTSLGSASPLTMRTADWLPIPGEPQDGYLHIRLTRRDKADITGDAWIPISTSATVSSDGDESPPSTP